MTPRKQTPINTARLRVAMVRVNDAEHKAGVTTDYASVTVAGLTGLVSALREALDEALLLLAKLGVRP